MTDAHDVSGKMLKSDPPPDSWENLLAEAKFAAPRLSAAVEQHALPQRIPGTEHAGG